MSTTTSRSAVTFATNAGDIAGGEVMLLQLAAASRDLGCAVTIVTPASPGQLLAEATAQGFRVIEINARTRRDYALGLRAWCRAELTGLLWCNGLVPALATAGLPDRVIHLHQLPQGKAQLAALAVARRRGRALVVPSRYMADAVDATEILPNWVPRVLAVPSVRTTERPMTLGFLGRFSVEKGLVTLADALALLDARAPGRYRLLLAGGAKFVPDDQVTAVDAALSRVAHLVEHGGWMGREEFFAAIDLAVFPSERPEAFGLVVAEAQSARVPYVVSDAGALPEVAGRSYPWVARAGDPESLATTIERAASSESQALVDGSFERWLEEFSPTAGRRNLARLLGDLGVLPQADS